MVVTKCYLVLLVTTKLTPDQQRVGAALEPVFPAQEP